LVVVVVVAAVHYGRALFSLLFLLTLIKHHAPILALFPQTPLGLWLCSPLGILAFPVVAENGGLGHTDITGTSGRGQATYGDAG